MKAYKTLIKERLPLIPNLILAFGLMLSSFALALARIDALALIIGAFALFLFVGQLRFMDELKDYEKDLIANPDRPLPRGAISKVQLHCLIRVNGFALLAFVPISAIMFNPSAALALFAALVWLYLMYEEFFIRDWLSARPFLYAISHQVVIFPLCLYAIGLASSETILSRDSLAFATLILSAFFTFEVGRKLDPNAHKILKTYLVEKGIKTVITSLCLLQMIAIASAYLIGMIWWIAPASVLILLSIPKLIKEPLEFKKLEGLIALNLIYVIWSVALKDLAELL